MVKNTTGGSKTKGQARKFTVTKPTNNLRLSEDVNEMYAQVVKNLGCGMCHVLCTDGVTRLCHIRGKFRGRGKRDNFIGTNSWLLVGLREWEVGKESSTGKLQNCDIIEVYTDSDKDKLKNTVTNVSWSQFIANDNKTSVKEAEDDNGLVFAETNADEYREILESQLSELNTGKKSNIIATDEGEINVDDI